MAALRPRVFVDADALIAGSASTTGASHVLLRLSEFTVIECICSEQVMVEAERNILSKLPHALPMFRLLARSALQVVGDPEPAETALFQDRADPQDLPLFVAAMLHNCHYLVTFNTRHYWPRDDELTVLPPGELLRRIRQRLAGLIS